MGKSTVIVILSLLSFASHAAYDESRFQDIPGADTTLHVEDTAGVQHTFKVPRQRLYASGFLVNQLAAFPNSGEIALQGIDIEPFKRVLYAAIFPDYSVEQDPDFAAARSRFAALKSAYQGAASASGGSVEHPAAGPVVAANPGPGILPGFVIIEIAPQPDPRQSERLVSLCAPFLAGSMADAALLSRVSRSFRAVFSPREGNFPDEGPHAAAVKNILTKMDLLPSRGTNLCEFYGDLHSAARAAYSVQREAMPNSAWRSSHVDSAALLAQRLQVVADKLAANRNLCMPFGRHLVKPRVVDGRVVQEPWLYEWPNSLQRLLIALLPGQNPAMSFAKVFDEGQFGLRVLGRSQVRFAAFPCAIFFLSQMRQAVAPRINLEEFEDRENNTVGMLERCITAASCTKQLAPFQECSEGLIRAHTLERNYDMGLDECCCCPYCNRRPERAHERPDCVFDSKTLCCVAVLRGVETASKVLVGPRAPDPNGLPGCCANGLVGSIGLGALATVSKCIEIGGVTVGGVVGLCADATQGRLGGPCTLACARFGADASSAVFNYTAGTALGVVVSTVRAGSKLVKLICTIPIMACGVFD